MTRVRATAVILNRDSVLLIRRVRPGYEYFIFPGGGVDAEETVEEALIREVKEETSLTVKSFTRLFVIKEIEPPEWITIHKGVRDEHIFLVSDYAGKPLLSGPEKERATSENQYHLEWIPIENLRNQRNNIYPQEIAAQIGTHLLSPAARLP